MSETAAVINLFLAFILGGGIGWFREKERKTAGMRTHILVCMGSALFMVLSAKMMILSPGADPGRLAAGIATGIGFIGAGCIVQTGSGVRGITTAASIWVTAAIGVAAGAGFYVEAVTSCVLVVAALQVIRSLETRYFKTKEE